MALRGPCQPKMPCQPKTPAKTTTLRHNGGVAWIRRRHNPAMSINEKPPVNMYAGAVHLRESLRNIGPSPTPGRLLAPGVLRLGNSHIPIHTYGRSVHITGQDSAQLHTDRDRRLERFSARAADSTGSGQLAHIRLTLGGTDVAHRATCGWHPNARRRHWSARRISCG